MARGPIMKIFFKQEDKSLLGKKLIKIELICYKLTLKKQETSNPELQMKVYLKLSWDFLIKFSCHSKEYPPDQ